MPTQHHGTAALPTVLLVCLACLPLSTARTAILRRLYPAVAGLAARVYNDEDDPRNMTAWKALRAEEAANMAGVIRAFTAEEVWFDDLTAISSSLPTTICLDAWWWEEGGHNAEVACRQLGFAGGQLAPPSTFQAVADTLMDQFGVAVTNVRCKGNERKLEECMWTYNQQDNDTDCHTGNIVSVRCWGNGAIDPEPPVTSTPPTSPTPSLVLVELDGVGPRAARPGTTDVFAAALCELMSDTLAFIANNTSTNDGEAAAPLTSLSISVLGYLPGPHLQPLLQILTPPGNQTDAVGQALDFLVGAPNMLLSTPSGAKRFVAMYKVRGVVLRRMYEDPREDVRR